MLNCLVVGAGGFLGSVARYLMWLIPVPTSGLDPVAARQDAVLSHNAPALSGSSPYPFYAPSKNEMTPVWASFHF